MKKIIIISIFAVAISAPSLANNDNGINRDPLLIKQMERVRSVSYSVSTQSYAGELKNSASKTILYMLRFWGVETDSIQTDAHLNVLIRGMPLKRRYEDHKTHYTGADVEGVLSFRIGDLNVFEKSFNGIEYPSKVIYSSSTYENPSDAPFGKAFSSSGFKSLLLDLTSHKVGLGDFIRVAAGLDLNPSPDMLQELMNTENNPNVVLAELLREKPRRDSLVEGAVLGEKHRKILEVTLDLVEGVEASETIAHELLALASDSTIITSRNKYSGFNVHEVPRVPIPIKNRAIVLLGQWKYHKGVEKLILLLKYGEKPVRVSAANALGEIGDKRAIEPLVSTLISTRSKSILDATYSALRSLTNEEIDDDEAQWVLWWESSYGREVVAYCNRGISPLIVWIIIGGIAFAIVGFSLWGGQKGGAE